MGEESPFFTERQLQPYYVIVINWHVHNPTLLPPTVDND